MARQARQSGAAEESDLKRISQAWRTWAAHPDGWISLLHGELLWQKPV
jgi:hypothetical protein